MSDDGSQDGQSGEQNPIPTQPPSDPNQFPVHTQLDPTNPTPAPPAANWQQEYTKLKAQYDGLSGFAKKEKNRADNLSTQNATLTEELESSKVQAVSQVTQLTQQLTESRALTEQLQTEVSTAERTQELSQLIRTDFPELAGLHDQGLLLGLEGLEKEALTEHLGKLKSTIVDSATERQKDRDSGSVPPSPGGAQSPPTMTLADAQTKLEEATTVFGFNSPEYLEAYNNYMVAVRQT